MPARSWIFLPQSPKQTGGQKRSTALSFAQ